MPAEEYAIVLDYLPKGKGSSFKSEPIAQVIGTEFFTLLEIVPKGELKAFEKVYVGKDERDKVEFIKRRIGYKDLTSTSVAEIKNTIKKLVKENEKKYVEFYNNAGPITIRRHKLELLPSLGKKHTENLLEERDHKKFESFDDIEKRVDLMPDPGLVIVKRILRELEEEGLKHYLFVRPPAQEKPHFRGKH